MHDSRGELGLEGSLNTAIAGWLTCSVLLDGPWPHGAMLPRFSPAWPSTAELVSNIYSFKHILVTLMSSSLLGTMQSQTDRGWEDLLRRHLVSRLTLQDLQSLSACSRGFQAFVRAAPQELWLLVAR